MTRVVPLMIWEAWRLTWQSLLLRVVIVSLIAMLMVYLSTKRGDVNAENMVLFAMFTLVALQAVVSSLYAKFGQDRPGFPFYLGFTRPVPTWTLVLVPLGYFALSMAAMYFIPVSLLILVFDARLPLFTGSFLIGLIAIIGGVCNWWSVDKLQRGVGWLVAYLAINHLVFSKVPVTGGKGSVFEYLMGATVLNFPGLIIAALLAVGVAVYGVGKQRHGDAIVLSRLVVPGNLPGLNSSLRKGEFLISWEWMKGLYSRPCPTRSPVAAETWREMKIRGVPVIAAGVLVSIIVPILWFLVNLTAGTMPEGPPGTPSAQAPLLFTVTVLPLTLPFFIATANLFGIARRQGVVDVSKFDATLPVTTVHQVALRLLVALGSLFVSLGIIGTVLWFAMPLVEDIYDYTAGRAAMLDTMTWFELIRNSFVYLLQFITVAVCFGILQLLWVLYTRRILYGVSFFLVYILFLALGIRHQWFPLDFAINHLWGVIGAVIGVTVFVFVDVLRRYVLKPAQAGVLFGVWLLFVPAYFSGLKSSAVLQPNMPVIVLAWLVMISVLPLTATVLAPWTVSKFRNQ